MGKTVLIVDDEKNIVDILSFNLKREGYSAIAAYDGEEAVRLSLENHPDLILLDVMLPKLDGFEVCKRIRGLKNNVPIIMLTAREDETDKVLGLELGADDYIVKPFSVRELLARVKANIRRTESLSAPPEENTEGLILRGEILIDPEKYTVFKGGASMELTQREYDLLKFLALLPGKVFSREELMSEVWQYDYFGDLRAVDVTVRRLRAKIEDDPANPEYIMTKRGVGYYFEVPEGE